MQRAAPRHPQRTQDAGTRADRGSAYLVESCGQSQQVTSVHCGSEKFYRGVPQIVGRFQILLILEHLASMFSMVLSEMKI